MKINIKRQASVLSLPSDFISLQDITRDGKLHYVVKYEVNVPKAVKLKAFLVKINVNSRSSELREVSNIANLNPQGVLTSLLRAQTDKVEANRAYNNDVIHSILSDITSKVPNDKTRSLTTDNAQNNQDGETEQFLFKRKGYRIVKASELTNKNVAQPILQTPLFQSRTALGAVSTQQSCMDLILNYKIDPSSIGAKADLILDTKQAQQGVSRSLTGIHQKIASESLEGAAKLSLQLLTSVLSQNEKVESQAGLTDEDYVYVEFEEQTNSVIVEEDLFINISDVGDQFYLTFQLQDINEIEVQTISSLVRHSSLLAAFILPTIPPYIKGKLAGSAVRLDIKQLDPNAIGVFLYRKVIRLHSVSNDSDYVLVAKIPLKSEDGFRHYIDNISSLGAPVIYRVVSYNRQDYKSSEFSSVVVSGQKPEGNSTVLSKSTFLSLSAKILDKTIQLELNNLPPGVCSARVYRRDLSRKDRIEESLQIGNVILLSALVTPDMRFYVTDTAPVDQRIYEYRVLLTFKDGSELWSSAPVEIQFTPVVNSLVSTTASPLRAVNVGSELDVQFNLASQIIEGKLDKIKHAMEQQGLISLFQSDLVENKASLQNLLAYGIKRTNLTTSEVEDLGIFLGNAFSDRTARITKGAKALQPSHEYEYTITTYFRSAATLLPTFLQTVTNRISPARSYSYLPSKWLHPLTLQAGSIVTASTLRRNHANTDFTFGTIGSILNLRIALDQETPSVQKATSSSLGKGKVLLQWELKGRPNQVDHFLIIREEMGMFSIAGKAHALTDTKSIQFIDVTTPKQIIAANTKKNMPSVTNNGFILSEKAITYHITPVLYNYVYGATIKTAPLITRN